MKQEKTMQFDLVYLSIAGLLENRYENRHKNLMDFWFCNLIWISHLLLIYSFSDISGPAKKNFRNSWKIRWKGPLSLGYLLTRLRLIFTTKRNSLKTLYLEQVVVSFFSHGDRIHSGILVPSLYISFWLCVTAFVIHQHIPRRGLRL